MKKWMGLWCLVSGYAAISSAADETRDLRVRSFVMPTRVVWTSPDSDTSSVSDPDILLSPKYGQVPEGVFLQGAGCRMENRGDPASVLVDFGRELHGGIHLASGGASKKGMKVRVRFGESVAEAMAELGERGAGNDHAIRDSVVDLPWLGTREIGNSGFRFVRIDLVTKGVLSLESVRAVTLMRDMPRLGSFTCSDPRVNEVWIPRRARCTSVARNISGTASSAIASSGWATCTRR